MLELCVDRKCVRSAEKDKEGGGGCGDKRVKERSDKKE